MSNLSPPLPNYAKPPVVEVVFAVGVQPLPLSIVDLARFGLERLGGDFPVHADHPPVQMPIETFGGAMQSVMVTLSLLTGPPPVRLWFQSEDRTRLVQVQRDWFACNWQGASSSATYPRYEANEPFFSETWDNFAHYIEGLGHGVPTPNQCELTYINHILPGPLWDRYGQISKVIRLAGDADSFLPEPEDGQVVFRYRIPFEGRPVGRLYVQATPALRSEDSSPLIQLQIIARGAPIGEGRSGVIAFFRLAHEWIVRGFAAVTTDAAQAALWERQP